MKTLDSILGHIRTERERQDKKWGRQDHSDGDWMLILQEELGEAAKDILEGRPIEANVELVQCAAVIVAWLESRYRRTDDSSLDKAQRVLRRLRELGADGNLTARVVLSEVGEE